MKFGSLKVIFSHLGFRSVEKKIPGELQSTCFIKITDHKIFQAFNLCLIRLRKTIYQQRL